MLHWENRPEEIANLFNPAFCSILLFDAIKGFQSEKKTGLPYPLIFLVLPLILHKSTREGIPKNIRAKMHVWVQKYPEFRINFSERTKNLVPYAKEALSFGIQQGTIEITENATLSARKNMSLKSPWNEEDEPAICRKKAKFLGRWLAKAGDVTTIFAMWGICP